MPTINAISLAFARLAVEMNRGSKPDFWSPEQMAQVVAWCAVRAALKSCPSVAGVP